MCSARAGGGLVAVLHHPPRSKLLADIGIDYKSQDCPVPAQPTLVSVWPCVSACPPPPTAGLASCVESVGVRGEAPAEWSAVVSTGSTLASPPLRGAASGGGHKIHSVFKIHNPGDPCLGHKLLLYVFVRWRRTFRS